MPLAVQTGSASLIVCSRRRRLCSRRSRWACRARENAVAEKEEQARLTADTAAKALAETEERERLTAEAAGKARAETEERERLAAEAAKAQAEKEKREPIVVNWKFNFLDDKPLDVINKVGLRFCTPKRCGHGQLQRGAGRLQGVRTLVLVAVA